MNTYDNITGGCNIYLDATENNQVIPEPIAKHLATCKIAKVTIEYIDNDGQHFQVVQLASRELHQAIKHKAQLAAA